MSVQINFKYTDFLGGETFAQCVSVFSVALASHIVVSIAPLMLGTHTPDHTLLHTQRHNRLIITYAGKKRKCGEEKKMLCGENR